VVVDQGRFSPGSELAQSWADLELPGCLHVQLLDDAVVDHHGEALAAMAHAEATGIELQPEGPGELGITVSQHEDLVAHAPVLAPGVHHENVVDRHAGDSVDALRLDLPRVLDIARKMAVGAGRGEGPRDGKEHDFLAAEEVLG